ncbi:ABC transporter permease [Methylobacterium nodulans]|uniref:Binding-protein-dependent transport systems inner membrane component n=1 Tax=Methylobacterium nodulans (strain LMG 21967 / CNCM I-2342 / ORS 2060) TaxID=460265 RepID=B8IT09_METNO|nr:ABC transporter permease subunit [Methylobacterium nodulans]ACL55071.1 binding-protein-dependent transport systems inner membrane component [Methylobacterium nodulans ORS 2060]
MTLGARPLPVLAFAAAATAAAALAGLPLLTLAPNRLVPGAPVGAGWAGAGAALLGLLAAGLLSGTRRRDALLALAAALTGLAVLGLGIGAGAAGLLAGQPPAARASLGAGAWIAGLALALIAGEAVRATALQAAGLLTLAISVLAGGIAVHSGLFDSLSLVVEYRARAGAVNAAILQHLALAAGALALAVAASVPLALLSLRRGFAARLIDTALNGVQVVPALALFAALVSLLSGLLARLPGLRELGLGAIGPTPAVIGTAAYLALPLVRSLAAGLAATDPTVVETARALGLTPWQVLLRVRLPLGAPILLGGLRVAAVQSIGLTTLGGLVGAGGLGAVVFDGMAQFAPDLIVLGAVPVIALSLAVDRGLAALNPRRVA